MLKGFPQHQKVFGNLIFEKDKAPPHFHHTVQNFFINIFQGTEEEFPV